MSIQDFFIITGLILTALFSPVLVAWVVEKINKK